MEPWTTFLAFSSLAFQRHLETWLLSTTKQILDPKGMRYIKISLAVTENGKGRLAALHQRTPFLQHKRGIECDTRLDYRLKLLDFI